MPGLNKRCVLNTNILQLIRDYPFINLVKLGGMQYSADVDLSLFDANGYATNNAQITSAAPNYNDSIMQLPSTANAPGSYVLSWTGTGTIQLDNNYVWTVVSHTGTGFTEIVNGRYSGTNIHVVVNLAGFPGGSAGLYIRATDPSATGDYLRDLKFYMLADETDLLAGKVFRTGWKNTILDLNPGCIRAMDWTGGSATLTTRWSDRLRPDSVSYTDYYDGTRLVPYAASTGTNAIVVAPATGMPVAMTHGEIAQFKLGGTAVLTGVKFGITDITKNANGVVTCPSHGFTNGQKVVLMIGQGRDSMYQMHWKVCTVAGVTTDTFQTGVNTSGFATFTAPGDYPGACVMNHLTLNVGARGEYPVVALDCFPIAFDAVNRTSGGYGYYVFDKYIVGDRDVGPGAWIAVNASVQPDNFVVYEPGVPIEVCTALVNELNAQKQATTGGDPINLWITAPPRAMMSVDPDYTSAENWAVKAVDIALNGDGGSWPGLTSTAALLVEFSNETWNTGIGAGYLCRLGQLRYDPGAGVTFPFTQSINNISGGAVIRSIVMCQDLATAYPTQIASGRLQRIAGGLGVYGLAVGGGGVNEPRVWGESYVLADAWNVGGTNAYVKFEAFAWASYFNADRTYEAANLGTASLAFAAAAGNPTSQESICQTYVTDGIVAQGTSGDSITYFGAIAGSQFNTVLGNLGKISILYEGGYDWATVGNGPSGGATGAQVDAFQLGIQRSVAWAAAQKLFFEYFPSYAHSYHPAIFIQQSNNRWGYTQPYPDTYLSGVEGGALNLTWAAMGDYNHSQDIGSAVSTTVVVSSGSPSSSGASVTFTATVTGGSGTPTGSVVFKDGVTTLGSGLLNGFGVATYSTSALAAGTHSITGLYSGDVTYGTSSGSVSQVVTGTTSTVIILGQACL